MSRAAFDRVGDEYLSHLSTMRGHVRQEPTREFLLEQLHEHKVFTGRVIDVGGGDGRDLRWLAEVGGEFIVKLADPSAEMLRKAKQKTPRLTTYLNEVHELAQRKSLVGKHDLVLSHGVLMYDLRDPQEHVNDLVALAKRGGLISLLTKGYAGTIDRMHRQGRPEVDIAEFRETGITINNLNRRTRAYRYEDLERMLTNAGAKVLSFAGVRLDSDSDDRQWLDVPYDERAEILKQEYIKGKDPILRHRGQMLHVVAKKR